MSDTAQAGEGKDATLTPLTDKEGKKGGQTDWSLSEKNWPSDSIKAEAQAPGFFHKKLICTGLKFQ